MKHIIFLLLVMLPEISVYAQDSHFKVSARPWIKGQKEIPWKEFNTRTIAQLKGFIPVQQVSTNKYESDINAPKLSSTGFFRVEQIQNRWWMIDPEGYRHIQKVVVGLRLGPSERNKNAMSQRFGSTSVWIEQSAQLLHSLGFSGTGSWSDEESIAAYNASHKEVLTRSTILSMMSGYGKKRGGTYQLPGNTGYPNQCIFVFDPDFEMYCDEVAKKLAQNASDPHIIGYFSDNELPLGLNNLEGYLTLANPNDPGRVYAEKWLKQQGVSPEEITDRHRADFAGIVADRYYQIVSSAIRKYDPNHLFLGSRLHGGAKFIRPIIEAAGRYCDIVSINYYGDWTPNAQAMDSWGEWAKKPFIITEFYTKGMDSGLGNTTGAGFTVQTQQDRGYAFQHFVLGLIESGNCVGWHWFRYQDNDPTAKGADPSNLDSNKGLVDNEYQPYLPLTHAMKELNINAYRLADFMDKRKR
ncbi:agarase [Bacteroides sp.]|uniref:agarase n=1 Tax=Bacteroides sp. TaxID=29523 RepID=UPI002FC72308